MVEQRRKPDDVIGAYYAGMEPFWHPVLPSEKLSDGPAAVELLGRRLVVVRLDGEPAAFDDVCRHLGAALPMGQVVGEGRHLRCAYHG